MTPDEFRKEGGKVIEWIAQYMETVDQYPVRSVAQPEEILKQLPPSPPEQGEENMVDSALEDLNQVILKGITHWQSPRFFAYFPANADPASLLGDFISSGLGVQGMLWITSPACTEVERLMCDWVGQAIGLPAHFLEGSQGGGVIQDSASSATLCALIAAREQILQGCALRSFPHPLTVYCTAYTHASLLKAVRICGLGDESMRTIPCTSNGSMDQHALQEHIRKDRLSGAIPCFVMTTLGTTARLSFDDLTQIAPICEKEGIWLHVDAAMAGGAAVCPELSWIHQGIETADSYCFNPHKWWGIHFDCDCFYVKKRTALTHALSVMPSYLRNQASDEGQVWDYRDWQIPLGRRFRALKIWFYMRHHGLEGIRSLIRHHLHLTQICTQWMEQHSYLQFYCPPSLNLICFYFKVDEWTDEENRALNQKLLNRLNDQGTLYLTSVELDGLFVLRLCIGQRTTELKHIQQAWDAIQEAFNTQYSLG